MRKTASAVAGLTLLIAGATLAEEKPLDLVLQLLVDKGLITRGQAEAVQTEQEKEKAPAKP